MTTYQRELLAVVAAGLIHVVMEMAVSEWAARAYNVVACLGFLVYLVWRVRICPGILRNWGMRRDNFRAAMWAFSGFGVAAVVVLVGFGIVTDSLNLSWSFWMTIALYPLWGVAQQFALQNLIAANLAGVLRNRALLAGVSTVLFATAHFPRVDLMLLTLPTGFFFTLIYRRVPNLWAVGIVHGILGSLAVYIVLGEDPGAALWSLVSSRT